MDPPQLLRRTVSPFVANNTTTMSPSGGTVAEGGHHGHHHSPSGGHSHSSHGHDHHHHSGPALSPYGRSETAAKATGMSSPSLVDGGFQSQIASSNIPFRHGVSPRSSAIGSSSSTTTSHGLFSSQPLSQLNAPLHGHSHGHGHGDHDHDHHDHHDHNHSHGSSAVASAIPVLGGGGGGNGFAHQGHHHDQHSSHSHDHAGHGHQPHSHSHGSHDHDHHGHDHSHGHAHSHGHGHGHGHSHDHHGHDHHGHDHGPKYTSTFQSQLPSYSAIFSGLMPKQKTMFTWILVQSAISVFTWLSGLRAGSLAITGLSYMLLFDAFGVLNIFISSVMHTDRNLRKSTIRNPFGVQRFETLFGLFNAIFLLFVGMNMLKESLEHMMLEDDHHGGSSEDHHTATMMNGGRIPIVRIPMFWTLVGLGATLISAVGYQNHQQFCILLNRVNGNGGVSSTTGFAKLSKMEMITRNQFSVATLGCVAGVGLVWAFPRADSMDKIVAICQSIGMFWLGGPLAKVLGMILLQTAPPMGSESLEEAVRQLSMTNGAILGIEKSHLWTNTFGQLIGTLILRVRPDAEEQQVLTMVHQHLQGYLDLDAHADGTGELTVQLVKV